MMANLFSSFDPVSSFYNLPLNWLSSSLGLIFLPYLFWALPSRWSLIWVYITSTLHKEFAVLLSHKTKKSSILFVSLFSFIMFNNFLGLLPYVFTSTSHMTATLTLALPLWLSFMIYGWLNHTNHMFAHLVPLGTPTPLMPFMVVIETISNTIRPATLAIRLAANMIAGHLLLTLLGNSGSSVSTTILFILISAQILLLLLEAAVAIIQAYVFSVLSTLYASEVN